MTSRDNDPLGASPAITTEKGDPLFEARMKGRHFDDRAVGSLGGRMWRPESPAMQGRGSSLAANPGSNGRQAGAGSKGRN